MLPIRLPSKLVLVQRMEECPGPGFPAHKAIHSTPIHHLKSGHEKIINTEMLGEPQV